MTEEIKKDICSRNKRPNMTIGSTEDTWPSLAASYTEAWYTALADTTMEVPLWEPVGEWKQCMMKYAPVVEEIQAYQRSLIQPDRTETCVRVDDVISLAQRFNGPEAALFVAAAQDFLEWVKNL